MNETKLVRVYPGDYSHEETLINDYACFGWQLTERQIVKRNHDGNVYDVEHDLTFQRDFHIKNREKLEDLFVSYTIKEQEIQRAANSVKLPKSRYVISFLICTVLCCLVLYLTVYPAFMEVLWNPGPGLTIFMILLVFVLAACGGLLLGIVPIGLANSIKQRNAAGAVKGRVYREMSEIARRAAQYLQ